MADSHASHPLGPPTVSGTDITIDTMLNQPTRITRMISDLTLERFLMDKIFSNDGSVSGGSVIYDQATENELYPIRGTEIVAPGAEFPILTDDRSTPNVATVDKWGGKAYITDEAVSRNDVSLFTNQVRKIGNDLVRKMDALALAELATQITAFSRTMTGVDWTAVVTAGTSATTAQEMPMRDFIEAQALADAEAMGTVYDTFLLSPNDNSLLYQIYGASGAKQLLADLGISTYVSNQIADGTMYAVASQQVGGYRLEKPLTTETWREEAKQQTWVQTYVLPVFYVTNPYSVLEVTGIEG